MDKIVSSVFEDSCGHIYAKGREYIFRLTDDETRWKPFRSPDTEKAGLFAGPVGKGILGISKHPLRSDRRVWEVYVGSGCGLALDKPRVITFPDDPVKIRGMKLDHFGNLWFATRNGLYAVSPHNRWRHFTAKEGLLQTTIQCIGIAPDKSIWVGTDTPVGFSRLASLGPDLSGKAVWRHFPNKIDSYDQSTFFLSFDSKGNLWRGTGSGIYISDGKHFGDTDWRRITVHDGLRDNDVGLDGFLLQRDGTIWVTSVQGITRFSKLFSAPSVHSVEAKILDRRWLSADHRSIQFDLAIIPPSLGHEARLEYRIPPGSWRESDKLAIQLRDVANGANRIEVRAAPNRWLKNERIASASFVAGTRPGGKWWLVSGIALAAVFAMSYLAWRRRTDYWRLKALYSEVRYLAPEERSLRLDREPLVLRAKLRTLLAQEASQSDATGATLAGRFLLEHVLARGGFATVYFGRDLKEQNAPVAVKLIRESHSRAEWMQRKWSTERELLNKLAHPNIIRPRFAGEDPSFGMFIITDYVEGITLRSCLNQGIFSVERTAARVADLCDALSHAHEKGVVHCDLKPDNIMLRHPGSSDESAVLIDFGVSILRSGTGSVTATAHVAGALDYMAPEQLGGSISAATDLYSLAAIVFEMLTGWRWREAESQGNTRSLISGLGMPKAVDTALCQFFSTALAFNREERMQSAAEFRRRFADAVRLDHRKIEPEARQ